MEIGNTQKIMNWETSVIDIAANCSSAAFCKGVGTSWTPRQMGVGITAAHATNDDQYIH